MLRELAFEADRLLREEKVEKQMRKARPATDTDRKTVFDETLTKLEEILDKSELNSDEIVMVLDCLKVRYASGP